MAPSNLNQANERDDIIKCMIKVFLTELKKRAKSLKSMVHTLYLTRKDPRIPWSAKILGALVIGYAFSPVDLIPDPIPILGYVDDLLILPLGIALVIKMIPQEVIQEYEVKARYNFDTNKPRNWIAGSIIILIWILCALWLGAWLIKALR